jgi:hypothetical protein
MVESDSTQDLRTVRHKGIPQRLIGRHAEHTRILCVADRYGKGSAGIDALHLQLIGQIYDQVGQGQGGGPGHLRLAHEEEQAGGRGEGEAVGGHLRQLRDPFLHNDCFGREVLTHVDRAELFGIHTSAEVIHCANPHVAHSRPARDQDGGVDIDIVLETYLHPRFQFPVFPFLLLTSKGWPVSAQGASDGIE